jgi:hypothetical protein
MVLPSASDLACSSARRSSGSGTVCLVIITTLPPFPTSHVPIRPLMQPPTADRMSGKERPSSRFTARFGRTAVLWTRTLDGTLRPAACHAPMAIS